jgi:hypothetical protein
MAECTLSSRLTAFYKFVFPTLWLTGFGAGTIALFVESGLRHGHSTQAPPPYMKWYLLIAWVLGALFIYWSCIRLKKVSLSARDLLVSNYFKTITIPLTGIERVSGTRMLSPEHLRISAQTSSSARYRFIFMPPLRFSFGFSEHPLAGELRRMVEAERSQQTSQ